ncbi:NADPH-dependent FMN reductase [Conexibacter sp. JD483]|uniref:NADPH-dependent FMN reductase n=1 Tax=unclassified Conexibacter TaxID=2627773 RepID=UPI0027278E88|nr:MULTISPECIES: NADPH-dependent FMN reductase [unclassified Conexibacter]MDO8184929.1 NADPH-dependent FMN reductase [Conexibacter sp. CPCC 205706]MDO8198073.1 NADPH-dependent FMN reductase [Conexibacter sp. CPCC 205762]MDR9371362.1 NADPH-dependent FMN reductase [Conexibacter sp. JD483]
MVENTVRVTVVIGSATPPGRLRRAVAEALERAERTGAIAPALIDLAEVRIANADGTPPEQLGDDTAATVAAIAAADAVVLATPVYRGSFTGVLKNLLDHVPVEALQDTPVGIVAMGATPHHFLGAESHLRDVLAFFGALVAPVGVYLTSADFADGVPTEHAAADLDTLLAAVATLARATDGLSLGGARPLPRRPKPPKPS